MAPETRSPARWHAPGEGTCVTTYGGNIEQRLPRGNGARAAVLGEVLQHALAAHPDPDRWAATGTAFAALLLPHEHGALTWALLRRLPEPQAIAATQAAFPAAGPPLPPWTDPREDAAWWASRASRAELRAYTTHGFRALPPRDRRCFTAWARRVA
jgi:hypothetical protein